MKLVFVATQRPNVPPFDRIQQNALLSWLPVADLILMCHVEGRESHYIGEYEKVVSIATRGANDLPAVSAMLDAAKDVEADVIVLTNADIIVTRAIRRVSAFLLKNTPGGAFCAATRRYDVDTENTVPSGRFDEPDIESQIRNFVVRTAAPLHRPDGMDVFMIGRGWDWSEYPAELVVGAPAWDNKLAAMAIKRGLFVDTTPATMVLHQNHERNYDPELTEQNRTIGHIPRKQARSLAGCTHRVHVRPSGGLRIKVVNR